MKMDELARPGLIALGLAGVAATALLGFAAGVAVARDPQALQRTARRVARGAALGLEQATLLAAQAREHIGDLWAEAREEALAEVDAADFERAARASSAAPAKTRKAATATTAAGAPTGQASKPARKRASRPRKPRASTTDTAVNSAEAEVNRA